GPPRDPLLPPAPQHRRQQAPRAAPPPPGHADARPPARGADPWRGDRGYDHDGDGRRALGRLHPRPRGGGPAGAQGAAGGGAGGTGPAGPRGAGPAALRAALTRRGGAGAGDQGEGGGDAVRPRPAAAQGDPRRPGRRLAGVLTMADSSPGSDPFNELAHEFVERYRRGERPSPTEYAERYPDLAEEIRELFPMLAMMERHGGDGKTHRAPGADPTRR